MNAKTGEVISGVAFVEGGDDAETIIQDAGDDSVVIVDGDNGQIDVAATIDVNNRQTVLGGGGTLEVIAEDAGTPATFTAPGSRPTITNLTTGFFNSKSL